MKSIVYSVAVASILLLSSCELIGGIFKAGVWTGIIAVAVVLGLIIWLISKGMNRD
ncbi:phosphatidate cytidylyltransferase [Chitinophaga sp. sic0106]|uniref:phosphatidate cytidylyltransferase n=1 Tax=Chitinophaga sp. sic0106 TaxID=2854785 RepID=UPI001C44DD15|nr:phosphatidate cytidylyltransferase [Chitinophaga sp. sic0106]MBV7532437.1 phosphatidate cytidylyltransferase [Chitinophaga sp. sic0106]